MTICVDGDRKAFNENAEWTKRKNQEKIEQLRKDNKELRLKLKERLEVIDRSRSLFLCHDCCGFVMSIS